MIKTIKRIILNIKKYKSFLLNNREFDYGYLDDMILLKLKHMLSFYSNPDKCMQVDESRLEIVAELKEAISLFKKVTEIDVVLNTKDELENRLNAYTYLGKHSRKWWD